MVERARSASRVGGAAARPAAARLAAARLAAGLAVWALLGGACGGSPSPVTPPPGLDPVAPATTDSFLSVARSVTTVGHPSLVARLRRDPFTFYRYVAGPSVAATCQAFAGDGPLPRVNLHGDAHLEQYAVAEDGRGLADFDAATTGPFVVDLVRFATSLRLAARMRGFEPAAADRAIGALLTGYRASLRDPTVQAPEPRVIERLRRRFAPDVGAWLDRVERLMVRPDAATHEKVKTANVAFVDAMLRQNPDLAPAFFEIRSLGILRGGVGSVHEKKFLARVAGPTDATDDDVIYEVKEVAPIAPGTCVTGDPERDPRRVIQGQARLSGVSQRFLGFVEMDGRHFYVHTWRVNYTELDIDDLEAPQDLAEVAFDVGVQLGRGHPSRMDHDGDGHEVAAAVLTALPRVEGKVREVAAALETRSVAGWRLLVEHETAAPP